MTFRLGRISTVLALTLTLGVLTREAPASHSERVECFLRHLEGLHVPLEEAYPHSKVPTFPQVDRYAEHRLTYTRELPKRPAKNQCDSTCWANAGTMAVEYVSGAPEPLSANFVVAKTILREFREVLSGKRTRSLEMGNFPRAVLTTIEEDGVVPESIYPSNPNVDSKQVVKTLNQLLKPLLDHGRSVRSEEEATALYQRAIQVVESNYGRFPRSFQHEGKTYESPVDFRKTQLPEVKSRALRAPENSAELGIVMGKIANSIDQKKPVMLGYMHVREALDPKTGFYDANFRRPLGWGDGAEHLVVIVGYKTGAQPGQITHLKIKNSHGDPDILHMPVEYLYRYGRAFQFFE